MREIKFRAWDYEDKKMWKVVAISASIWGDCEEAHIRICDFDKSPCDEETNVRLSVSYSLMQFTGLKDKNGREIYEGDVLLFNNTHPNAYLENWLCVVKYRCGSFVCEYPKDGVYNHFDSWNDFVKWEVIGNVFENSDLLEDKR